MVGTQVALTNIARFRILCPVKKNYERIWKCRKDKEYRRYKLWKMWMDIYVGPSLGNQVSIISDMPKRFRKMRMDLAEK